MVFELNNNLLLFIVFGIIVLWVFTNTNKNVKENLADFKSESSNKIDQNMCSKQCCKFAQWPLPKELYEHTIPEEQLSNYIGSNLFCSGGDKSGCLCITQDESSYLSQRGGNSLNNTCNL
jgi:hypothetical protein